MIKNKLEINNKNLIITDPCYISYSKDWGTDFKWSTLTINKPEFSDYLWDHSGYGDGSPLIYSVPRKYDPIDSIQIIAGENIPQDFECIGKFSMDSGCMGVFYLDEVLKYNPDCLDSIPEVCYEIIENFTGTVENVMDEDIFNHYLFIPKDESLPYIITE